MSNPLRGKTTEELIDYAEGVLFLNAVERELIRRVKELAAENAALKQTTKENAPCL